MSLVVHLWQSTLCLAVAAALVRSLRRAPARTRHGVWLLASLKFLVPFSLLTAIGSAVAALAPPSPEPRLGIVVRWLDQSSYFWNLGALPAATAPVLSSDLARYLVAGGVCVWAVGAAGLAVWRWKTWRAVRLLAFRGRAIESGRETQSLARVRTAAQCDRRVTIVACDARIEPSVLGLRRPTILWPVGLSETLTDLEVEVILGHEMCHVRHRDNAVAVLQMMVETLFWFHPAVWWLSGQLVNEREQACDEEVLQMGTDKRTYASSILSVCGFCLRSPLACIAGVGGSHLTQRIERIMEHRPSTRLATSTRMMLTTILILVTAAPIVTGALGAGQQPSGSQARTTLPRTIKEAKPGYTAAAMRAGIQGRVVLQILVRRDGTVGDVTVTRSLDTEHGLDNEAVKAAKQWRFAPGTRDGKPVPVSVELEMTFTLR